MWQAILVSAALTVGQTPPPLVVGAPLPRLAPSETYGARLAAPRAEAPPQLPRLKLRPLFSARSKAKPEPVPAPAQPQQLAPARAAEPPPMPALDKPADPPAEAEKLAEAEKPAEPPAEEPAAPAQPATYEWALMRHLQGTWPGACLEGCRTQVYGFTEVSYTTSSQGPITWPILFQSPTNEFLLNQNWITIERPVVTTGTAEPTFGFRVDANYGSDSRFIKQRGLLEGQTERAQFDPYQFYAQAYFPTVAQGLDVKIGRVAVPYMAEVTPNVFNPFFSHSYAYYFNPFTHTGVITTLKLSNAWSVGGWFTLGNDIFFDPAASGMFVGTLQWTSPDQRDTALLCVGISSGRFNQTESFPNQNHIDLVYTHKFDPRLRYTLDAGVGYMENVTDLNTVTWSWAVNYLAYDFTPQLTGTARLEFFDDPQGFKTGFEGLYTAVTAGVTIKPVKSLLIRPELRYDYNTRSRPFGDDHGLFTAAMDVILRW